MKIETQVVEMHIWCIEIGIVLVLHCKILIEITLIASSLELKTLPLLFERCKIHVIYSMRLTSSSISYPKREVGLTTVCYLSLFSFFFLLFLNLNCPYHVMINCFEMRGKPHQDVYWLVANNHNIENFSFAKQQ
jgi:hypothetical protein